MISCTPKGKALWNELFEDFLCERVSYELVCKSNNIEHSGHWAKKRKDFFCKVTEKKMSFIKFEYLVWKSSNKVIKKTVMKVIGKFGLL